MENRHGLLMDFTVSLATGTAERNAVPALLDGVRGTGLPPAHAATTPRPVSRPYGRSG